MDRFAPLLLLGALGATLPAWSQKALRHYDEAGEGRLVTKVTETLFYYGTDSQFKVPIREARTLFRATDHYVPGFIRIDDHSATHYTRSTVSGAAQRSYWFEIKLEITPTRDFEDVVLVFDWDHPKLGRKVLTCPVGRLYADRSRKLRYELSLGEGYTASTYHLAFLTGGVEVFSAPLEASLQTPLEEYEASLEGPLPHEADPRPIFVKAPHVRRLASELVAEKGEAIVKVRAKISPEGYVVETKVVSSPHPVLSEDAVEAIRLWRFAPRFAGGKPVATEVVVPFRF